MANVIPEHYTPKQLRDEAVRRELVERAENVAGRITARNDVVDALEAIDLDTVRQSDAELALWTALKALAEADRRDREQFPTNGEVNLAGPHDWWERAEAPHIPAIHPSIYQMQRGQRRNWRKGH